MNSSSPSNPSGPSQLRIVVLGLSITSSWGNGHATTYRSLLRETAARGHQVTFLERDVPWYASSRDAPADGPVNVSLYGSLEELRDRFSREVRQADAVIVGSFVPDGIEVGAWVQAQAGGLTAFYDIDTPVTLAKLARGECEYLNPRLIAGYDLYLSFTGGPTLQLLERKFASPMARVLYCSVDPKQYYPEPQPAAWDLGYMGTYSEDRQPPLDRLLVEPARAWGEGRFVVAGPQYPERIEWPANVERIEHLPPHRHRDFYNSQRFTLNITRADMIAAGWSPSVRLFEAAACATPIISDRWPGLEALFAPDREIVLASDAADVLTGLHRLPEDRREAMGQRAYRRVLAEHTSAHRAEQLESHLFEALARRSSAAPTGRRSMTEADTSFSSRRRERKLQIERLGPWFHNLHLPDGEQTAPDHFIKGDFPSFKWREVAPHIPARLDGWRVLDIGCNAGFYSFELARLGASVVAIDVDPHYLAQARWAANEFGLQDRIEFRQMEVYELGRSDESFDLVWFMGVFYHLRYPLLALDILAQRTRRMMVFQTLTIPGETVYQGKGAGFSHLEREALLDEGWPKMVFFEEGEFHGDLTNWWAPNHAGVEAMLRSSGLRIMAHPAHELYLCAPDESLARRRGIFQSQLDSVLAAPRARR